MGKTSTRRIGTDRDKFSGRVSSTELHRDTKGALGRLRSGSALAVTQYSEVQGYLVAPDRYEALLASEAEVTSRGHGEAVLSLLVAAGQAGVAIPSDTLARAFPDLPVDWHSVAKFAATFPVSITHGEDGEPITRGRISGYGGAIEEYGSDDDLNLG